MGFLRVFRERKHSSVSACAFTYVVFTTKGAASSTVPNSKKAFDLEEKRALLIWASTAALEVPLSP